MSVQNENRRFRRFHFDAVVEMECPGTTRESHVIDVSLKGMLVERPVEWTPAIGTPCELTMTLDGTDVTIWMEATLIHARASRMGFRCDRIDLDSMSHLRRLVELNLGDADLLERELQALIDSDDPA